MLALILATTLVRSLDPQSAPAAQTAQTAEIVSGKLGATLDDYLSRCAAFGFSGSVLVESNGAVVLLKGYGLAEREPRRPNTPDTLFDIGSLTKQFTATAILRLEQDGKLSTADTLSKFFKDAPPDKARIQLQHLLTHSSGLPRGIASVASGMQERAALVKAVLAAPLESKPGQAFSYSNVGYDLLGAVVEIVAGTSYEDCLREKLFGPAQMASTGFRKDGRLSSANAARGYQAPWQPDLPGSTLRGESESPWEPTLATEGWYSWGLRGAGGVLTTLADLRAWQQALDGGALLKPGAKEKLFRPFLGNYACGWYVQKTERGSAWIEHGGTTGNGFDCKFTRFPDQRLLIIALGNVLGGSLPWVNLNLGKLARGETVAWPPPLGQPAAEGPRALEGIWEAPGDARFQLALQDGQLVLEALSDKALAAILPASTPRAPGLLQRTEEIAAGLARHDFKPVHAAEDRAHPLFFFDDWWRGLEEKLGPASRIAVIGVVSDPRQGDTSLIRVDYGKGAEILRLQWSGDTLTGTLIGPPYPSRRVLQPTAENTWTDFDLVASKVLVELRAPKGDPAQAQRLELAANGKSLALARRK
jgi:CubicO group peptidase (beta-lactamase class C family)